MVYQSSKESKLINKKYNNKYNSQSPGPGKYFPSIFHDKNTLEYTNKLRPPFGSNSIRNTILDNKIESSFNLPGPGSYCSDVLPNDINQNKNVFKYKLKQDQLIPLYKLVDYSDENKAIINNLNRKLGFNSIEKRFKNRYNENTSNKLGPGSYNVLNDNTKSSILDSSNKLKHAYRYNNINKKISKISCPSIPSKDYCYGFESTINGTFKPSEDPYKINKYKGSEIDSVGPGQYNINKYMSEKWKSKGTCWSKSQTQKNIDKKVNNKNEDIISTKSNTKSNINEYIKNNNICSSNFIKPKFKVIKNLFNKLNKIKKIRYVKDNNTNLKSTYKSLSTNEFHKVLLNSYNLNKMHNRDIFNEKNNLINPGPGYYNQDIYSSFNIKQKPEEYQLFGSSSVRFKNNNSLKDEIKSNTISLSASLNFKKSLSSTYKNKKINNKFNPYSYNLRKNNFNKQSNNKILNNTIDTTPGPGSYDVNILNFKKIHYLNNGVFGSTEKRFPTYIDKNTSTNLDNHRDCKCLLDKKIGNSSIKIKCETCCLIDNSSIIKKRIKVPLHPKKENDIYSDNRQEFNSYLKEVKNLVPPVGSYNPDKTTSIQYNSMISNNMFSLKFAPFWSLEKRFNNIKDNNINNLGPGYYYKDNKLKLNQIKAPFNSIENKITLIDNSQLNSNSNLGPGHYDVSSFYEWNKKSFNIKFI